MNIHTIEKYGIAYALLPYKRNQDVIRVIPGKGDLRYAVSVVDGWNWKEKLDDDTTGRKAAHFIAHVYPKEFLKYLHEKEYSVAAEQAAERTDQQLLTMYPKYVSAVATFLLNFQNEDVLVYVGKGVVLLRSGASWEKPKEIGDYFLNEKKFGFPNEVSRFFGRGELKGDPLYSCKPDVVVRPAGASIFFSTDGIEDIFTQEEIIDFLKTNRGSSPREIIERFFNEVNHRGTQRDDVSLLVRV